MENFFVYDPLVSGVKGLVYVGRKIIAFRRDGKTKHYQHRVDLPGGGSEPDETPFDTFAREVDEECGLKVATADIVYARCYRSFIKLGSFAWFAVAGLPETTESQIVYGDEGFGFLTTPEEYLAHPDALPFLQARTTAYLESLKPA